MTDLDFDRLAREFQRAGRVVFRLLDEQELIYWNQEGHGYLNTVPEMLNPSSPAARGCIGGFGVFGESSSFHNPFVRNARLRISIIVFQLLAAVDKLGFSNNKGKRKHVIKALPDRFSVRYEGTSTTPESVHRDNCEGLKDEEAVIGTILNLDLSDREPQKFSSIEGSHILTAEERTQAQSMKGFAKITDKEEKKMYKKKMTTVDIPPGCICVFYSHMLHEVFKTTAKYTKLRLYTGFDFLVKGRFLHARNDIINDPERAYADQGILQLPSGQKPPMFANMHQNQNLFKGIKAMGGDTLPAWSVKTFKPQCLQHRQGGWKESKEKPRDYTIVHKYMPSLAELGLPLYPVYTDEEKAIYTSGNTWRFSLDFLPEQFRRPLFESLVRTAGASSMSNGAAMDEDKEGKEEKKAPFTYSTTSVFTFSMPDGGPDPAGDSETETDEDVAELVKAQHEDFDRKEAERKRKPKSVALPARRSKPPGTIKNADEIVAAIKAKKEKFAKEKKSKEQSDDDGASDHEMTSTSGKSFRGKKRAAEERSDGPVPMEKRPRTDKGLDLSKVGDDDAFAALGFSEKAQVVDSEM